MSTGIEYAVAGHAAWITINRPAKANAVDTRAMEALVTALGRAAADHAVRVVALIAVGDRHFCAGRDLDELETALSDSGVSAGEPSFGSINVHEALLEFPKPTVAAINGAAIGGGLEMALACDLRIASDTATFAMPEAALGTGANFGSVVLSDIVGRSAAFELLYTADRIPAGRALQIGLVNRVVPAESLRDHVETLVGRMAANSPVSLRRIKATVNKSTGIPLSAALRLNLDPNPYHDPSRVEGLRARREGRRPNW